MSDEIHYPEGFAFKDIISRGSSGLICLDSASRTVVKSPHDGEYQDEIAIEKKIYERLNNHGGHVGLLSYHGSHGHGFRLQFAPNGDLRSFLGRTLNIETKQRLLWAQQIASALHFVHSENIIHGDVRCSNVLRDEELNAKLADFGGSSLDGSSLLIEVMSSHRCPGPALSVQGDLFALGSTLYEIFTGGSPFSALPDEEIQGLYASSSFAETLPLASIGYVIEKRWKGENHSANDVATKITELFHY